MTMSSEHKVNAYQGINGWALEYFGVWAVCKEDSELQETADALREHVHSVRDKMLSELDRVFNEKIAGGKN